MLGDTTGWRLEHTKSPNYAKGPSQPRRSLFQRSSMAHRRPKKRRSFPQQHFWKVLFVVVSFLDWTWHVHLFSSLFIFHFGPSAGANLGLSVTHVALATTLPSVANLAHYSALPVPGEVLTGVASDLGGGLDVNLWNFSIRWLYRHHLDWPWNLFTLKDSLILLFWHRRSSEELWRDSTAAFMPVGWSTWMSRRWPAVLTTRNLRVGLRTI